MKVFAPYSASFKDEAFNMFIPVDVNWTLAAIDSESCAVAAILEAAEAENSFAEPLIDAFVTPAKAPPVIFIVPATFTVPPVASNFIWLPLALPAKKLPLPSTKKPVPLLWLVGGVAPRAILPPLSVDKSKVDVSIFKSSVTNSRDVPVNVNLFPLALPTLKLPLVSMNTPVPAVLVAVEAFDVSNANFVVFINKVFPPFNVKLSVVIDISPLPSCAILFVLSPSLNWPVVYQ